MDTSPPPAMGSPVVDVDAFVELRRAVGGSVPVVPSAGPVPVAFVGQRTFFEVCSQTGRNEVIHPTFVDFRSGDDAGDLRRRLDAIEPAVVVVFRPEIIPVGVLRDLDALRVGFLTEPLPRVTDPSHPDLDRRLQDLAAVDPEQFDRVIAFDPHIAEAAGRYLPVWRSQPLPVADEVFTPGGPVAGVTRSLFVGRSTPHRDWFLLPAKHRFDLLHVEHGVFGEALASLARDFLVAVNLHNEPYPSFENRVPLHLAVGNLVLSEPLSPANGLDPDLDYLLVRDPEELVDLLELIEEGPERFDMVRVRGHQKAEGFRASVVYARLLGDLLLDVAEFGRG